MPAPGSEALKAAQAAAIEGAQAAGQPLPTLLAVTVLTSWQEQRRSRNSPFLRALLSGCRHWRSSRQLPVLAAVCAHRLRPRLCVVSTPSRLPWSPRGIRPKGAAAGDQARVMGPAEAMAAGASQLVIGRPITQASDPSAALARCCAELA